MTKTNSSLPDGVEEIATKLAKATPLRFRYRNWEGKVADRSVRPKRIFFGKSEWHPDPQFMLLAHDLDRDAERCFALQDILEFLPPPVEPAAPQEPTRAELIVEEGYGRLLHEGEPKWRALRKAVLAINEREFEFATGPTETIIRLVNGPLIGRIWHAGAWNAYAIDFELWGPDRLSDQEDFFAIRSFPTQAEAEAFLRTVFIQAGGIVR